MYKKILVPIDGSETSQMALDKALLFAVEIKAEIIVLYVVDSPIALYGVGFYQPEELKKGFIEEGNLILQEADEKIKNHQLLGKTLSVSAQEHGDSIANTIKCMAKDLGADLIIMGTHGRRGLGRLLLGSTAEEVVRITSIPVTLIPYPDKT